MKNESFEMLLSFMVGDNRIRDAHEWSITLRYRLLALGILERRVLEQIVKTSSELEEASKSMKAQLLKEYMELRVMYEAYLNAIYSLFENISQFVRLVYPKKNLPWGFSDQKKKLLTNNDLDKDYSEILKKTEWYDKVIMARHETVHFLSGIVTIGPKGSLGYSISNAQNPRAGTPEKISVESIKEHVKETHININQFLNEFAYHFFNVLDQDSRAILVCLSSSDEVRGVQSISIREYLNGESGVCEHRWQQCPEADLCKAKKR